MINITGLPLSKRLKASTHAVHDALDRSIMEAMSFTDLPGYGRFVELQYLFHRDIDALYDAPALQALFPRLVGRRRLALIAADLDDLGREHPTERQPRAFSPDVADVAAAIGWLYVAEGSNLGAALLRKDAAGLGLSDHHGARHLAPAPGGPAAHWRAFTAALDAIDLDDEGQRQAVAGANAAFARVQAYADARLG